LLVVRDQGIGIAPETLPRLFVQFERGRNTTGHEGLGLGLWIVKRMVEAHGGDVSVASAPGAGSTFTVSLPKQPRQA
jgi:signal transduction histidine kinase